MATKAGREYELLIEKIYRELEPNAEIKQDDYIFGEDSKIQRQIDLSIRSKIAGVDILIIVQAKDYKHKADVNIVGQFSSVIKDVKANKGILISNSGFTKAAIQLAKRYGIELYSAHTALNKRWDIELKIPVIRTVYDFKGEIEIRLHVQELTTYTVPELFLFSMNEGGDVIGFMNLFSEAHEKKQIDYSGKFHILNLNKPNLQSKLNDEWVNVNMLIVKYQFIALKRYLAYYTPDDYRGLKDYIKSGFITTHINLNGLIPLVEQGEWQAIKNGDDVINTPLISHIEMMHFSLQNQEYVSYTMKTKHP